jgi:hypothetical protein
MASTSPFRSPMPMSQPGGDSTPSGNGDGANPASAESLFGDQAPTPAEQQSSLQTDADRQFVTLIRTIHNEIDTLAKMRPEFAPFAERSKKALTDGMVKAMSSTSARAGQSRQTTPQ